MGTSWFCWVDLDALSLRIKVYPLQILQLILEMTLKLLLELECLYNFRNHLNLTVKWFNGILLGAFR